MLRFKKLFYIGSKPHLFDSLSQEGRLLDIERYYVPMYPNRVGNVVSVTINNVEYIGVVTCYGGVTKENKHFFQVYLLTDDGWSYVRSIIAERKIEELADAQ